MPRPDRVVIFADENDLHSYAVKKILAERYDVEATVVDFSHYPLHPAEMDGGSYVSVSWADGEPRMRLSRPEVELTPRSAIWWRRPQGFTIPPGLTDPALRDFTEAEWRTTLDGAVLALGCRVINDFGNQRRANNKLLQLRTARDVGLVAPRTLVTNSMHDVREFVSTLSGPAIFKPQTHSRRHVADARLIDDSFWLRELPLTLAPVVIQEFVPAEYDLRLNVVGTAGFATRIPTNSRPGLIDWRLAVDLETERVDVDLGLLKKCRQMLDSLGLFMGAFDFRITPAGECYFFEVNPSGQFLFCEVDERLDITDALCRGLVEPI
jgi:hypothetical protein